MHNRISPGMNTFLNANSNRRPGWIFIQLLKEKGIKPTAMMDVSDGLSSEVFTSATIPVSVVISTKKNPD